MGILFTAALPKCASPKAALLQALVTRAFWLEQLQLHVERGLSPDLLH